MTRTYSSEFSEQLGPNSWILDHIGLEARMGSFFYGASLEASDIDVRGFFIPPRDMVLPFRQGEYIHGFGTQPVRVDTIDRSLGEVDLVMYSVVKLFDMLLRGNPNVFNILLLEKEDCSILRPSGEVLLSNRRLFLGKNLFKSYIGFADSCLRDIGKGNENPQKLMALGLRQLQELIGMVTDLDGHSARHEGQLLTAVRSGEVSMENAAHLYSELRAQAVTLEANSSLPDRPDELRVRNVLWELLEAHFGDL